ncbi:Cell division control protein 15 [Taphrina deformans PYCC 5710]|uniref:Cell division control protein 15 n=1 Tax=Taphrina deformans (strain PYCC 5710 / ATCC 11124 / CBS 356.35 / IMI 108563 / JCM 9778 / NBRC 8474) TaxID=1097556 RepID=R4X958_TAPDE|nr:Cell division control protein 15 [Taphrina deformans PYCC 5710]|eukprot:CCG82241.1 Cell division control protein 15 [Taphrina deformans PYCC 5710]
MVLSNLVDPDASSSHSFSKEDIQKQRATFALSGLKLRLEPDAPASPFSSLPFQFSLKEGFNEPQAPVLSKPAINDELDHQNDLLQYISDILQYDYTSRDLRALLHDGVITCRVLDQLLAGTGKATERKYMHGSRSANVKRATLLAAKLELSIEDIDSAGFQDIEICERIMLCILSEARNQGMSITAEGLGISQGHTVEHFTSDDAVHETVLGVATAPMRFRGNHSACASLAGEPAEQETDARYSLQPSILKGDHQPTAHAASISRHEMILPETKPLSILPSASLNRPRQSTKLHRSKSVEPSSHTKARQSDHPQDDSNRSSPYRKSIASDTGEVLLLGDVLGRGQFGTVYRAIDTSRGCIVAVKQIPVANRPLEDIGNMMKEIEILKALSSPYIVRYVGYHEDKQFVSIIVEYVENGSLRKTIRTFGCFNEKLAAGYTSQILQGLVYLHSKDVVHCDVKCANVLTTKTGDVKLSDFGISLFLSGQSTVRDDSVNGTPNWLAPEVISLRGTTKASDIWAL